MDVQQTEARHEVMVFVSPVRRVPSRWFESDDRDDDVYRRTRVIMNVHVFYKEKIVERRTMIASRATRRRGESYRASPFPP